MTRITLDANVLFYAFDARDPVKQLQAIDIIAAAGHVDCPLALQTIGEFFVSVRRRLKLPGAFVRRELEHLIAAFETFPATQNAHLIAAQEAAAGRFFYWDAVLLASAAEVGCTLCLSEDMQDEARLGSLTVRNPFGKSGVTDAVRRALAMP